MSHYLAVDLGAESGRVVLGTIENGALKFEELHRFPNQPVHLPTGFYWDTLRLWREILHGLTIAGRERKLTLNGIGVDTWGVDFALLGSDGALVDNPRHYRDARNNGIIEQTFSRLPKEEIFAATGIQFLQFNTLFQWHAMKLAWSPALEAARTLLFMPDLFNYFLTGRKAAELTIASTSQLYNPVRGVWAGDILHSLRLEPSILPELVVPGTFLGPILPYVAELTGLDPNTPVFATASHDTAAAVAAVPAGAGTDWCYISSGTWSLMGVELDYPILSEEALEQGFTNEIGAEGRVRFLKNIAGMWLLQECRRAWAQDGHDYGYEELVEMAAKAPPFVAAIQPDAFLEPGNMPARIADYCRRTGQETPANPAGMCLAILESLALRYRQVLENLEAVSGRSVGKIHIVGGGSRNRLLNQFVADATRRPVLAGPAEGTAIGNILVQAMGAGEVVGLDNARALVRESSEVQLFEPNPFSVWDAAYERFCALPADGPLY